LFGPWRPASPGRQVADGIAGLPVGQGQVVLRLQAQPELRLDSEPVAEAQGCVAGDRALARDDLADAVRRHIDLARELGQRNARRLQFALEDQAGVDDTIKYGVAS